MNSKKILSILDKAEAYLSQILLLFFVTLVFSQTVLRGMFDIVWPWSEELSRFAFVWFVYFGTSYAARLSAHNRVVIQFKFFPPIVGKISMFITDILWIIFNFMMIYMSIIVIQDMIEYPYYSPALGWSMAYVYSILPLAFLLMNFRIIQVNYIRYILKEEIKDVDKIEAEEYEILGEISVAKEQAEQRG